MGGDGGILAYRTELVKTKKKAERFSRDVTDAAKWRYCALSQQPLQQPIVTCSLGRLYNKEALIRALVDKTISTADQAKHIKSLKDVRELNLTKNPDFERLSKSQIGGLSTDTAISPFICPIVGLEMNGKYRFCVLWNCGCVFSERAIKEVTSEICQKCGKKYSEDDVVVFYGTDEEIAKYRQRFELLKSKQKAEKLNKKPSVMPNCSAEGSTRTKFKRVAAASEEPGTSKIKKLDDAKKSSDMKSSIQADESKTEVYKSLFTSSESAKNQPKAHWVTYNPLYY